VSLSLLLLLQVSDCLGGDFVLSYSSYFVLLTVCILDVFLGIMLLKRLGVISIFMH
jgi:hypothetical protein